jgi:hypothetical protein
LGGVKVHIRRVVLQGPRPYIQPVLSDANQSVLVVWVADRQSLGIATIDTDDVRRKFGYHLGTLPGLHIGLRLLRDK